MTSECGNNLKTIPVSWSFCIPCTMIFISSVKSNAFSDGRLYGCTQILSYHMRDMYGLIKPAFCEVDMV